MLVQQPTRHTAMEPRRRLFPDVGVPEHLPRLRRHRQRTCPGTRSGTSSNSKSDASSNCTPICCAPVHGILQQSDTSESYFITDPRPSGVPVQIPDGRHIVAADRCAFVGSKLRGPDVGPDRNPNFDAYANIAPTNCFQGDACTIHGANNLAILHRVSSSIWMLSHRQRWIWRF